MPLHSGQLTDPQVYRCDYCTSYIVDPMSAGNGWCAKCTRWSTKGMPTDALWQCKDGTTLRASQMTQNHLQFSIGKIMRDDNWRKHMMEPLLNELKRRKDIRDAAEANRTDDAAGTGG